MKNPLVIFRRHALERMAERSFLREEVEFVLQSGEVIREYADDTPYPSRLLLGWTNNRPLHVVVADNHEAKEIYIITVYEPDTTIWNEDFRSKRA